MTYDDAVRALYQAPHGEFVAERKRLAQELTKSGHKSEAALLAKHGRPSVSAWVVNRLWARDEAAMKALFASGARVRSGDLSAVAAHRQTTAELVTQAAAILSEAGHSASEATLRKVSANLAALAAAGGFDPDPRGALRSDRDPPGFESMALVAEQGKTAAAEPDDAGRTRDTAAERARIATAETERRANEARQKARAERARFIAELSEAQSKLEHLERKRNEQQSALTATEAELANVRARVTVLQAELRARSEPTEEPETS